VRCQECEWKDSCYLLLGKRRDYVLLSAARFEFLPEAYWKQLTPAGDIEELYQTCHQTIFGKPSAFRVGQHGGLIVQKANEAGCSLRNYFLCCMVAQVEQQKLLLAETDKGLASPFHPKLLTAQTGVQWAIRFNDLCRKSFGTVDRRALENIVGEDYSENDLHYRMLDSEVKAGQFLVEWKMRHAGPAWESLYTKLEDELDEDWLAIEPTYAFRLQQPQKRRYAVTRRLAILKTHRRMAITVFRCREDIMLKALKQVLGSFRHGLDDFEIRDAPVRQPLDVWVWLGRARQHLALWRAVNGQRSCFSHLVLPRE